MKIFLSFSSLPPGIDTIDKSKLYGLYSYHYMKTNKDLLTSFMNFKEFMLDSGIFTYLNGKDGRSVDWEKYTYDYAQFIKKHQIKNYVEVDIDKIIGLKEVERLRNKLEDMVGWKSIPVWHMNRGYDKWLEICRDYDYVCFGAFITDNLKQANYRYIPKFLQDASKNNCKVHGLGITHFEWLKKLRFHSVDSSSWIAGMRWGYVEQFSGDGIKRTFIPDGKVFKTSYDVRLHNLNQWVKYVQWAETNL